MASREKLPSVRCYTIGWIAALTHEHLAATCMFDGDEHDFPDDFEKQPQDTNQYSLGKIGQHNVVITSIPDGEYGTVPAATTASNLVHSFPHIRIGLMVGIGAGLPKVKDMTVVEEYDIRLGDVVISLPNGNSPGVVQYDLGKMKAKKFERVGFLAAPPEVLRTGLTIMRGNHRKRGSKVPDILRKMVEEYPRLGKYDRQNRSHGFVHQGTENDRLFDASAPHFDAEGSCSQCNAKLEIRRDLRDSTDPFFYYGTIASGNSVVKNGMVRDVILQSLSDDCLCFEMEAAGLMNRFPCLVIRGICDYADSHKNDRWQNYAAATAAAYAKELLQYLQPNKVETERSIREVLGTIHADVLHINENVGHLRQLADDDEWDKVIKWLDAPDPSKNFIAAKSHLEKYSSSTTAWFLKSQTFLDWENGSLPHLWINGVPGCGKTVLTSSLLDACSNQVLYFFFDFRDSSKHSYDGLIRSLVYQLFKVRPSIRDDLKKLFEDSRGKHVDTIKLVEILDRNLSATWIVVDALDECDELRKVLLWLRKLRQKHTTVRLIITSRPLGDIKAEVIRWGIPDDAIVPADGEPTKNVIKAYIVQRLDEDENFEHLRTRFPDGTWRTKIEETLLNKADGMFQWTSLQLDALAVCKTLQDLEETLQRLPRTLYQTYDRILSNIPEVRERAAKQLLSFLLYSEGNLKVPEAIDVMAVDTTNNQPFDPQNRMQGQDDISDILPGLIKFEEVENPRTRKKSVTVALSHASVKDYLLSGNVSSPFNKSFSEKKAKTAMVRICMSYFSRIMSDVKATGNQDSAFCNIGDKFPLVRHIARLEQSPPNVSFPRPIWMRFLDHEDVQKKTSRLVSDFLNDETSVYTICTRFYDAQMEWNSPRVWHTESSIFFAILANNFELVQLLINNSRIIHNQATKLRYRHLTQFRKLKPVVNLLEDAKSRRSDTLLHVACERGNKHIIELLLDKGADPNECQGETFTIACRSRDVEMVETFLNRGAAVKSNSRFRTPLWEACRTGNKRIIKSMLDKGADPNECQGETFTLACSSGDVELVRLFLDRGAVVKSIHPLSEACQTGNLELAILLVDRGAEISERHFYTAIENGNPNLVEFLMEQGADATSPDSEALHHACAAGRPQVMQLFLDHGADIKDKSLLQPACRSGSLELVQLLLGVDTVIEDKSLLRHPCRAGSLHLAQLLIDHGADAKDENSLELACQAGSVQVVELLLDHGADANGANGSPLRIACQNTNFRIAKVLLDRGADANKWVKGSRFEADSLLEAACQAGSVQVVGLLLDHGADVNGAKGAPLKHACREANLELAQLLLQRGADVNASPEKDIKFRWPNETFLTMGDYHRGAVISIYNSRNILVEACIGGSIDIVRLLLDRGVERDADGPRSLYLASCFGNLAMIEMLLNLGVKGSPGYSEELLAVCYRGTSAMAKLFLDLGANPNAFSGCYLLVATTRGSVEMVKMLIKYRANVKKVYYGKWTALDIAEGYGRHEVAELLKEHGAKSLMEFEITPDDNVFTGWTYGSSRSTRLLFKLLDKFA